LPAQDAPAERSALESVELREALGQCGVQQTV